MQDAEKELIEYVMRRQAQLEKDREPWEDLWLEIYEHIVPHHSLQFKETETAGVNPMRNIYDSYGLYAARTMTRGLMSQMVNRSLLWFQVIMDNDRLMKYRDVQVYLKDLMHGMYGEYRRSNFYQSMADYLMSAVTAGHGLMLTESYPSESKLAYSVGHIAMYYIDENAWGEVDTVHRKFKMTARNCLKYFPRENLSDDIIREGTTDQGNKDQEFEFIHAIYPRDDYIAGRPGPTGKPFIGYYIDVAAKKIVQKQGYSTFPVQTMRWWKLFNERYGRGPGLDALVDVMGLQQIAKANIKSAQFASNPAYNVPKELRGETRLIPGGHNYYDETNRVISPIVSNARYDIGLDAEQRKRTAIDQHFMVDLFKMLSQIERQMTATEIMQRMGEKAALIAPVTSRMAYEAFDKIHLRTLHLATQAGRLPEPPEVLAGEEFAIEYTGPLALAQKRMYEQDGINRSLEQLAGIAQFSPEAAAAAQRKVKWEQLVETIFMTNGADPEVLRTAQEIAEIRMQEAQQQQQLMAQEELQSQGNAYKSMNQKPVPGSPAEALIGAA